MAITAQAKRSGCSPWGVDGDPEELVAAANHFLDDLAVRGRATYTLRSYAFAVADFTTWLQGAGLALSDVDDRRVADYLTVFEYGAHGRSGGGGGATEPVRSPATVKHRLSVVLTFLHHTRPDDAPGGRNVLGHGMPGRDLPPRTRWQRIRGRTPRLVPRAVDPDVAEALITAATSMRNKALLTLLWRTGQRIGDWHTDHGRHGLLGLSLNDVDRTERTVRVRLKGARDEHVVPVTDDFWPLWERYLRDERNHAPTSAAWVAARRGQGAPLTYTAFEAALRQLGQTVGVKVTAHMFRHAFAMAVMDTSGLKAAQELLGHVHLSTTADTYLHVDARAMVDAVAAARRVSTTSPVGDWVFPYDDTTIEELDALTTYASHDPHGH